MPPRQEEEREDGEVGRRQDQGHVPYADPVHQPIENEQADQQIEAIGRRVEAPEQGRELGFAPPLLKDHCVLVLRQIGEQQRDEHGQREGGGIGRGPERPCDAGELFADARRRLIQVHVAVRQAPPTSAEPPGHGRGEQGQARPDQQEAVHREMLGEETHNQRPQGGAQGAERREQGEEALGVLDVEVGVGERPEQRVEADVPHRQVQLERIVRRAAPGGRAQFDEAPEQGASCDEGRQRHVDDLVRRQADGQNREHGRIDQHHAGREQEDHRESVGPDMAQKGGVARGEPDAHAGLQQQAEQAELQQLRPFAGFDPEQAVQQPLHPCPPR